MEELIKQYIAVARLLASVGIVADCPIVRSFQTVAMFGTDGLGTYGGTDVRTYALAHPDRVIGAQSVKADGTMNDGLLTMSFSEDGYHVTLVYDNGELIHERMF